MVAMVIDPPAMVEPTEWFIVFHRRSLNRVLSLLTVGEFKHVSAFGYLPGVKLWLVYDVQWSGTRIRLFDKQAVMTWTDDCAVVKIAHTGQHMRGRSRLGFTCVNAIKHLIGLAECVAITPTQLYRHVIRHGGTLISEPSRPATDASRSDAATGAAAGA